MRIMSQAGSIEHEGIVENVSSDSVDIRIASEAACSGCHAEGFCSLTGKEHKIIHVEGKYKVEEGDTVSVVISESTGYKAVFLGYLLPLLILIISLVLFISFSVREIFAGLFSIGVLVPYFLILYFFRERINQNFTFTLKT